MNLPLDESCLFFSGYRALFFQLLLCLQMNVLYPLMNHVYFFSEFIIDKMPKKKKSHNLQNIKLREKTDKRDKGIENELSSI